MYISSFKRKRGRPCVVTTKTLTTNPMSVTLLQQLKNDGLITERQYDCAQSFQLLHKRYLTSIHAPALNKTNWNNLEFTNCDQSYHYTAQATDQDIRIKAAWRNINMYLKSKMLTKYDKFIKYILHDDVQINQQIIQSQHMIDIICSGLIYLDG